MRGRTTAPRLLLKESFQAHSALVGRELASPRRRGLAFALDCALLLLPSLILAVASAMLWLSFTDPAGLQALRTLWSGRAQSPAETTRTLGDLAPLLVRLQAPGLPPAVALAVAESDLQKAGELLSDCNFDLSLTFSGDDRPLRPNTIRIEIEKLLPGPLQGAALFGVAALYFTFFTARSRRATLGKRLLRLEVVKLDGRPLTVWESFERFGGYLASFGTLGLGLLDLWNDPNRRLAHDRVSNTVVLRRDRAAAGAASPPSPEA